MTKPGMLILGFAVGAGAVWISGYTPNAAPTIGNRPVRAAQPQAIVIAAQGRVEGASESVPVGAGADGLISAVLVQEGQQVRPGQIVAEIDCGDVDASIRSLAAAADSARQVRVRVLRGSREEERAAAAEQLESARALRDQAKNHEQRLRSLLSSDAISKEAVEVATTDLKTAEAAFRAAEANLHLTNAGALPEELARADADVLAAGERLRSAVAQRGKCDVRAPLRGTVIQIHLKKGESFSSLVPRPILTIADTSKLRVRAEIDERDIGRIRLGQAAVIHPEGFAGVELRGRVTWLASTMGRKTIRSTDPAEKSDRDVLEVLIDIDQYSHGLALGLRVFVELAG